MNSSKLITDKQIVDLSQYKSDLNSTDVDSILYNPQSDHEEEEEDSTHFGSNKDPILPSYDFQPISRPATNTGPRVWNSLDSKPNSLTSFLNSSPLETEPGNVVMKEAQKCSDSAIISEIDRTMKNYTDSLLHAIDGLSTRLSQLESRTRQIEYSVEDSKISIGNDHGSTDGKMRNLENLLLQLQSGMQDLKDKQEVMEGHLQLAKLQVSNAEKTSETPNAPQSVSYAPQQSQSRQFHVPQAPSVPSFSPNAPQQNFQPPPLTTQFPPPQIPQRDSYFPPSGPTQEAPSKHYQMPLTPQPQPQILIPPVAPQPQQYPHKPANSPLQFQPPLTHHPEENPYIPPQSYPPNLRAPHSQQYYGSNPSSMYEPASGYGPPSGPIESYHPPYGPGAPSSNYPKIPTARILPQAIPTASDGPSGNRVPVDDVIDKVTTMGFPKEHVRATVRRLTENGQSVDLNVVLDKLMNDGFGR